MNRRTSLPAADAAAPLRNPREGVAPPEPLPEGAPESRPVPSPPRGTADTPSRWGTVGRFLIPLGHRGALCYFFDSLYAAHGLREGALRAMGRRLPGPVASRLAAPVVEPAAEVLPVWDAVRESPALRRAGPESPAAWILLADYTGSVRRRLLAFPFEHGATRPYAVLKLRPTDAPGPSLHREEEALRWTAGRLRGPLRETVPRVLGSAVEGGFEHLLLSFLPGRSPYVRLRGSPVAGRLAGAHFSGAAEWLARLHVETRKPGASWTPPDELPEPVRDGRPAWLEKLLSTLSRDPIPVSACHGDFWTRNVLQAGGALTGVVDWERFRREAPGFQDLFHYALSFGLIFPWSRSRRIRPTEAFRRTFLRDGAVPRAVRRYFLAYCRRADVEARLLPSLLRLHLLARAAESAGTAHATGARATPRASGDGRPAPYARTHEPQDENFWTSCYRMLGETGRSVFSG